ncbi:hypothetical protein [Bradyrhizobium sp. USDA 4502]
MKVTVKAIRDDDGTVLGETIFDIQDKQDRTRAVADLVNSVYNKAPDPLDPPPFTLHFDRAK